MPTKPLRPCNKQGCRELISSGSYCDNHKPKLFVDYERPSAYKRGYGRKWQEARISFLRQHPVCNCGQAASVVDHIQAHKGDMGKFWDSDNWQALCKKCHDAKTLKELHASK